MFEVLRNFFGGTAVGSQSIKSAVGAEPAVSQKMLEAQSRWRSMYEDRSGLHLASAISSEMARLITVELRSEVCGSKRAEYLNSAYQRLIDGIRIPVEYGLAKGGLVIKPYVSGGDIRVDFVQGDSFFPTEFDETGKIAGAVFAQSIIKNGEYLTRLERHRRTADGYEISNKAYRSRNRGVLGAEVPLSSIAEWQNMCASVVISNVKKPLFGYFCPAAANTIDPNSPIGVSVFAKAVNLIDDADRQYERLIWEFESGERALIANSMAFKHDRDGRPRLPDKKLYKTLDVEDIDFFREWSPELRGSQIADGLDKILRRIEFNCGLAYGTLSDAQSQDKTAEEVRASKQRSYAAVCDNQKSLKTALSDAVYAMDVWCTLYSLAPMGEYSISFEFDDSIVADRRTEFEEKSALLAAGIIRPWEMRAWYLGEDEETAKEKIEK